MVSTQRCYNKGYVPPVPDVEERLQHRYLHLIQEHLSPATRLAAGLRALPGEATAFASTQAAWRFYANPRTTLPGLAQPLLDCARAAVATHSQDYALVVHDWSQLHYNRHTRKKDRVQLSQSRDHGYELLTCLVVSDRDGQPFAPVCQQLRAQAGIYDSRFARVRPAPSQLDALTPAMAFVGRLGLAKPVVHIIDSEADSVAHYRRWQRRGYRFLVRADEERVVKHEEQDCRLSAVVEFLRQRQAFRDTRAVTYQGRAARQWVAETAVTLDRPARPHRRGQAKRVLVKGSPIALRLVVSEVRDAGGTVLARWLLLTNVPAEVPAETVALWYYWRWRIESYFKLLKGAGQHVEQWQQRTALGIAKRLLVTSMACVVVWRLARSEQPGAEEWRRLLVRLSGRQMKWGQSFTEPALLAGLWVLLAALDALEQYSVQDLRRLADFVRPTSDQLDSG
jgi:hypothetical protein